MNRTEVEFQTEIKMGAFDKSSEGQLDSLNARNKMFDEVQKGLVISPIYRSPENPGNNPEVGAMLGNFTLDYRSMRLPSVRH